MIRRGDVVATRSTPDVPRRVWRTPSRWDQRYVLDALGASIRPRTTYARTVALVRTMELERARTWLAVAVRRQREGDIGSALDSLARADTWIAKAAERGDDDRDSIADARAEVHTLRQSLSRLEL